MIIKNNQVQHFYEFSCFVKGRWVNDRILYVLEKYFPSRSREYYKEAMRLGVIRINNKTIEPTYRLKRNDVMTHKVHIHEPISPKIDVLYEDERMTVLNKPAGIPCHPVGAYHFYSVTKTVFGDSKVGCVNRLDMPVSGVVIVNTCNDNFLPGLEAAKKFYVAKVRGDFPESAEVDVCMTNKPNSKVMCVDPKGKPSKTFFKLIGKLDGHSLILCQPITGRTHQIRLHLKHLGFPIVGDVMYGEKEEPVIEKAYDCDVERPEDIDEDAFAFIKANCSGSNNRPMVYKDIVICLHAWKYVFEEKTFIAEWPAWAKEFGIDNYNNGE